MSATPIVSLGNPVEMFQKGQQDSFFNMKALAPRPMSSATDMDDTDFEDDNSDIEEDYSPRISLNSAGRRSETTLSSYDELPTPKSNNFQAFNFELAKKPVEGPKGPHLFRPSRDSSQDDEFRLTMSPVAPQFPVRSETAFRVPLATDLSAARIHRPISTLTEVVTALDTREVSLWNPRQVARWMYGAGFEPTIVEKFEENDISGEILVTLKFEDLRELDIASFGQRHKLWNLIHSIRDLPNGPPSPTVIECESDDDQHRRRPKFPRKKGKKSGFDDLISPLESVSIVGIEQLMPKPHKCWRGENCNKWRKQQRVIEAFHREHPVSPKGGRIFVAGDPGNPFTAEAARPFSDAQPSVVASSDVLGPGALPAIGHLEETALANLQTRDPQDNVKQFLNFQHVDMAWSSEEPATPPYEMFPALPTPTTNARPHEGLRTLPKLAIPANRPPPRSASAMAFSPGPMDRGEALCPELRNRTAPAANIYRFGTPASDMDVPVTAINLGPVARDASQSVPPNMNYRHNPASSPVSRSQSRSSRRPPSFPVLPRLDENIAAPNGPASPVKGPAERSADDVNHSGWMKKRKTRMLRHEWHEHHFTLKGTRLAMHKDSRALETLESIDVDDYAIACSSLASSKLNAAFKAMNFKLGAKDKAKAQDEAAFSFQLIPAAIEKGQRLKKNRESTATGGSGSSPTASTKTHHFAVKSRDERIDWMRELMLAKALKQKGDGFEINVNGNMI